jgi:hypothetical protein
MDRLRAPEAFGSRHDVVAALVAEPAVAFVAAENGGGGVRVVGAAGEADVERRDGRIAYRPISGDPLELGGAREGSADEWLEWSFDAPYPDAPFHLLDQFRADRAGDLVVIAREGYDFRKRFEVPEHKAGHGSLVRSQMQTPLWSSRPTPERPIRTIDVFPAMLDWLGVPVPADIDGRLLWRPGAPESEPDREPAAAGSR